MHCYVYQFFNELYPQTDWAPEWFFTEHPTFFPLPIRLLRLNMNREQNNMVPKKLDLPQDTFDPVLFQSVELEQMADEVIIHIHGADSPYEIKSWYGIFTKLSTRSGTTPGNSRKILAGTL